MQPPDRDGFEVRRKSDHDLACGYGIPGLGRDLARLEGRVALEEVLRGFPRRESTGATPCRPPRPPSAEKKNLPVRTP